MQKGYFDNAATTELCEQARSAIVSAMDCFGNPSSLHTIGMAAQDMLSRSRQTLCRMIKCNERELFFTSGGTESDNLALFGAAKALCRRGNRIVTTAFEHDAVIESAKQLEKDGFEVIFIKPDESGHITPEQFEQAINDKTILVSCMAANNEIGTMLPVESIKSVIKRAGAPALLHCDATQTFGKYEIIPQKCGIDLMTFSSHKIHGPKGVGALYISEAARIVPHTFGGLQQNGVRPGTEPTLAAAGFAAAADAVGSLKDNAEQVKKLKTMILSALDGCDDIVINSPDDSCEYLLNLSVVGIRSETMLHFLDSRGVYVSSGSACAKGEPSHVLRSMGLDRRRIDSALRISFSRFNTEEDCEMLIDGIMAARRSLIRSK